MPADSSKPPKFDESVLDQLACPTCVGGLVLVGVWLKCAECGRGYAIVDGIPVLIAERAVKSIPSE
jgi:uncharacterized protein YbaR (Trm112 family)